MNFIIMRLCSSLKFLGRNVNHQISVWNGPLGKRRESCSPRVAIHKLGKMFGCPTARTPTGPMVSFISFGLMGRRSEIRGASLARSSKLKRSRAVRS